MEINEHPFNSSQVAACRQTDAVKLKIAFLQLLIVNAPKKINTWYYHKSEDWHQHVAYQAFLGHYKYPLKKKIYKSYEFVLQCAWIVILLNSNSSSTALSISDKLDFIQYILMHDYT